MPSVDHVFTVLVSVGKQKGGGSKRLEHVYVMHMLKELT
jgi:hypothetical protein